MRYLKYFLNYLLSFLYDFYYFLFGNLKIRINSFSYYRKSKIYPDYLKYGDMKAAVEFLAKKYCQGRGVDIGGGKWPLPGARVIEDRPEENAFRIQEESENLDFVFSSHLLEHLENWQEALREWYRVLKPKGTLFLYLPHPCCQMWHPKFLKVHQWTPNPYDLSIFLEKDLKMEILEISFLPDGYLSFIIVARKS